MLRHQHHGATLRQLLQRAVLRQQHKGGGEMRGDAMAIVLRRAPRRRGCGRRQFSRGPIRRRGGGVVVRVKPWGGGGGTVRSWLPQLSTPVPLQQP